MTAKYLRAVWNEAGRHVLFRVCSRCGERCSPAVVFAMAQSYGPGKMRYPFCSDACRDEAITLRALGMSMVSGVAA